MVKKLILVFILLSFSVTSWAYDSAYSGAQVEAAIAAHVGRNTEVGDPGSDAEFVTEQAVREALDAAKTAADTAYEAADPTIVKSDEAETITENWDNTANPWAVNEVHSDLLTAAEGNAAFPTLGGEEEYTGEHNFDDADLVIRSGTSLPGTCTTGELFLDTDADTDGSLYQCVAADTWKEVDDDGGAGGAGDVTAVLDCLTGDCDDLIDAPTTFSSTDTTPDVSSGAVFITANASATTISDFDTELTNGKIIFVIVNDAYTTFDFTSAGLEGMANDYLADTGDLLIFVYATADSQWHGAFFPKSINVTLSGFTATRPVYSDASGNLEAGDDGGHLEVTGDDLEIKDDVVDSEHYVDRSIDTVHISSISESTVLAECDQLQPISDAWLIKYFPAETYPSGVVIDAIHITSSATCTDVLNFEEWTQSGTTSSSTVEAITLSGTFTEDDGTLADSAIAADGRLMVDLDATPDDIGFLEITIIFHAN